MTIQNDMKTIIEFPINSPVILAWGGAGQDTVAVVEGYERNSFGELILKLCVMAYPTNKTCTVHPLNASTNLRPFPATKPNT